MPEEEVDALKGMQPKPMNPLDIRDAVPPPAAIQAAVMGIPGNLKSSFWAVSISFKNISEAD